MLMIIWTIGKMDPIALLYTGQGCHLLLLNSRMFAQCRKANCIGTRCARLYPYPAGLFHWKVPANTSIAPVS